MQEEDDDSTTARLRAAAAGLLEFAEVSDSQGSASQSSEDGDAAGGGARGARRRRRRGRSRAAADGGELLVREGPGAGASAPAGPRDSLGLGFEAVGRVLQNSGLLTPAPGACVDVQVRRGRMQAWVACTQGRVGKRLREGRCELRSGGTSAHGHIRGCRRMGLCGGPVMRGASLTLQIGHTAAGAARLAWDQDAAAWQVLRARAGEAARGARAPSNALSLLAAELSGDAGAEPEAQPPGGPAPWLPQPVALLPPPGEGGNGGGGGLRGVRAVVWTTDARALPPALGGMDELTVRSAAGFLRVATEPFARGSVGEEGARARGSEEDGGGEGGSEEEGARARGSEEDGGGEGGAVVQMSVQGPLPATGCMLLLEVRRTLPRDAAERPDYPRPRTIVSAPAPLLVLPADEVAAHAELLGLRQSLAAAVFGLAPPSALAASWSLPDGPRGGEAAGGLQV